jgi:flagellar protein FliS
MTAYSSRPQLAAYQSVAAHGRVAAADPHQLVLMLIDGALERISGARGAMQNQATVQKSRLIHKAVEIVNELHVSLDMEKGGAIARNLGDLYDFMTRQMIRANAENRIELLDEAAALLREIRSAWIQIPATRT